MDDHKAIWAIGCLASNSSCVMRISPDESTSQLFVLDKEYNHRFIGCGVNKLILANNDGLVRFTYDGDALVLDRIIPFPDTMWGQLIALQSPNQPGWIITNSKNFIYYLPYDDNKAQQVYHSFDNQRFQISVNYSYPPAISFVIYDYRSNIMIANNQDNRWSEISLERPELAAIMPSEVLGHTKINDEEFFMLMGVYNQSYLVRKKMEAFEIVAVFTDRVGLHFDPMRANIILSSSTTISWGQKGSVKNTYYDDIAQNNGVLFYSPLCNVFSSEPINTFRVQRRFCASTNLRIPSAWEDKTLSRGFNK